MEDNESDNLGACQAADLMGEENENQAEGLCRCEESPDGHKDTAARRESTHHNLSPESPSSDVGEVVDVAQVLEEQMHQHNERQVFKAKKKTTYHAMLKQRPQDLATEQKRHRTDKDMNEDGKAERRMVKGDFEACDTSSLKRHRDEEDDDEHGQFSKKQSAMEQLPAA